jgi:hypothetical protein
LRKKELKDEKVLKQKIKQQEKYEERLKNGAAKGSLNLKSEEVYKSLCMYMNMLIFVYIYKYVYTFMCIYMYIYFTQYNLYTCE